MFSARYLIVPLLIVALAFAVAEVFPGSGVVVALVAAVMWFAFERRMKKTHDRP
jgi:NhaP-type Na+/H+ or K+/H+ antiporter